MDFRTQVATDVAVVRFAADGLLLVLGGEVMPADLAAPLAKALQDAVRDGDLTLKAGKSLYLHRVDGIKAERVAVAVAGNGSAKSIKAALSSGLALLKSTGIKHIAVSMAGVDALQATHGEVLACAVGEAVYAYSTTKPSAPAAAPLGKVTLLVRDKDEAGRCSTGLTQGFQGFLVDLLQTAGGGSCVITLGGLNIGS